MVFFNVNGAEKQRFFADRYPPDENESRPKKNQLKFWIFPDDHFVQFY